MMTNTVSKVQRLAVLFGVLISISGFFAQSDARESGKVVVMPDPEKDDYGAGNLTYPVNPLYNTGCFDLTSISIDTDENSLVFTVCFRGEVLSPPEGYRISDLESLTDVCTHGFYAQNVDIYIDTGRKNTENAHWLLPGRKAALNSGESWDKLICITPQPELTRSKLKRLLSHGFFSRIVDARKAVSISDSLAGSRRAAEAFIKKHISIPDKVRIRKNKIVVRIPLKWMDSYNIKGWKLLVIVTGAEISDSLHLMNRFRNEKDEGNLLTMDIQPLPGRFVLGGASGHAKESRIIDLLYPEKGIQEKSLSGFSDSNYCHLPLWPVNLLSSSQ